MTVTVIDNGMDNAVTMDTTATDPRKAMLTAAGAIASTVIDVEGKLAQSAKDWGCNLYRLVKAEGSKVSIDDAIGDSKVAAGWAILTTTDAGKKAKARLEVYFSNARLVAERWNGMDDAAKAAVLAGTSSIHYLAGQFRKADADAKKAAKKAAATAEAEAAKQAAEADAMPNGKAIPAATEVADAPSFGDTLLAMAAHIGEMTVEDFAANSAAFALFMEAYDAKVNAACDAGVVEVHQAA